MARSLTKLSMRQATADKLIKNRDKDVEIFKGLVQSEKTQKSLGLYLERLKSKA